VSSVSRYEGGGVSVLHRGPFDHGVALRCPRGTVDIEVQDDIAYLDSHQAIIATHRRSVHRRLCRGDRNGLEYRR
jgi:hypothetical protein